VTAGVAPPPAVPRPAGEPLGVRRVAEVWWPLAASWLMMGFELPAVSAVMARLEHPEISLAAYGGIVFPIALLVEAPIIMMLAASTALSRDRDAYRKIGRFVHAAGASLTALHVLVAATPLFDVVVRDLLGAPPEIRGPARIGLWIMTPWTWSIAVRRFQQGLLIRAGRSRTVGVGTAVRLAANAAVLALGWASGSVPGIVVGTAAVAAGVMAEAAFIGIAVRPTVAALPERDEDAPPLDRARFLGFYAPLVATSLLTMAAHPIASAAMGRMPRTLESLAAWPVVNGLTFTLRSVGFAFHEVVVALLGRPGAERALSRFAGMLAAATSGGLVLVAATPLARFWFAGVSGLAPDLAGLAGRALWLAILLPAAAVAHSRLSGLLVQRHATRGISEAVAVQLAVTAAVLGLGVAAQRFEGILVAVTAFLLGQGAQLAWLAHRAGGLR
jgi:hypothetical protein